MKCVCFPCSCLLPSIYLFSFLLLVLLDRVGTTHKIIFLRNKRNRRKKNEWKKEIQATYFVKREMRRKMVRKKENEKKVEFNGRWWEGCWMIKIEGKGRGKKCESCSSKIDRIIISMRFLAISICFGSRPISLLHLRNGCTSSKTYFPITWLLSTRIHSYIIWQAII